MYLVGALLMGISWTSCSDDNGVALPIELTNVTTIADMNTIEEAALGDFIAFMEPVWMFIISILF